MRRGDDFIRQDDFERYVQTEISPRVKKEPFKGIGLSCRSVQIFCFIVLSCVFVFCVINGDELLFSVIFLFCFVLILWLSALMTPHENRLLIDILKLMNLVPTNQSVMTKKLIKQSQLFIFEKNFDLEIRKTFIKSSYPKWTITEAWIAGELDKEERPYILIMIPLPDKICGHTIIMDSVHLNARNNFNKFQQISFQKINFLKNPLVYTTSKHEAYDILSSPVIQALENIQEAWASETPIRIAFWEKYVLIVCEDSDFAASIQIHESSNKPSFLGIYHQIWSVEQFVQQIYAHFNLTPTHQQKKE